MLGLSRKHMHAAMDQIIDFSGIGDFIDEPVKIYSSGMYVRLGFAVAPSTSTRRSCWSTRSSPSATKSFNVGA